jgi:hypothetical protein
MCSDILSKLSFGASETSPQMAAGGEGADFNFQALTGKQTGSATRAFAVLNRRVQKMTLSVDPELIEIDAGSIAQNQLTQRQF